MSFEAQESSPEEATEATRLLDEGYDALEESAGLAGAAAVERCNQALELFKRARELVGADLQSPLARRSKLAIAAAYSQRGHLHRYEHHYTESLADLSQGLRLNPANAEDYYYRALSYLANNDAKLARADLLEYLKRGENQYLRELARNRVAALEPGKEDAKATTGHWRAEGMRFNSEAANAANPRGEDVQSDWPKAAALYNKAIEAFNRALEASSNDTMTRLGLITSLIDQAEAYRQMEEYDLALANYDRAQQVKPLPRQVFLKAETLQQAGHKELARAAFEQYLALINDPSFDPALAVQAQKFLQTKDSQATR